MSEDQLRCSFVSYIHSPHKEHIIALQKEVTELTGSTAAWKVWQPHITLAPPVYINPPDKDKLINFIETTTQSTKPIKLKINSFGFMDDWPGAKPPEKSPFVIYLKISEDPHLARLAQQFRHTLAANFKVDYPHTGIYRFHITLAYADLTQKGYKIAKQKYTSKDTGFTATIDHVAIVHDRLGMIEEIQRIPFGTNQPNSSIRFNK